MDCHELSLLTEALTDLVSARGDDLCAALAEFGWPELLAAEPAVAVGTLFRLQGALLTSTTLLDAVMLAELGVDAERVALPLPPRARPWVVRAGRVQVEALLTAPAADGPVAVPTEQGVFAVPVEAFQQRTERGLDPHRAWTVLSGSVPVEVPVADEAAWSRALAAGRRALAAELLGVADRMLGLALEHTTTRVVFGRKLAGFQVVRHKLADVRVAGEVAELAVAASFEHADPLAATLAKAHSVRYVRVAREHVQQLLGGMGFSWEHQFHWYLRRALLLEPLLGGTATLRGEVGARLVEERRLPDLVLL
jgi:Acyl-CoA dehydrogenase, C-terminal domain